MAESSGSASLLSWKYGHYFTLVESKETNIVLRKPMVEKMRRDRINSSIEQLKSLLAPEFLNQQPDSKLEKADILEMTVSFLRQQQQQQQLSIKDSPDVSMTLSIPV
ncbi:hypothetical protein QTP86_000150 [Hemibagrus guttatus]|nr:hypothetical protein QTP86_000150 [Hemibagrus guttatus]